MTDHRDPALRYFEDLSVGQVFRGGTAKIEEAAIVTFAAAFDPQPFHTDPEAARDSFFGGLAASGWHTAAISMRLLVDGEARLAGGIIGGGGEISWPRPTRPGDVLTLTTEILELIPSRSKPDRGMIVARNTTVNQHGEAVQISTMKLIVPRRGGTATS